LLLGSLIALAAWQDPHSPEAVASVAAEPAPPPVEPDAPPALPFPLKDALDTDHDGKFSAAEIRDAAKSLKALDKNKDGKLSAEELGWPPFPAGGPGFGGPGFGGPGGGGPGFGPGGGPGFGRGGSGAPLSQRVWARDANKDGKISADELPKSMQWLIRLADGDKDGSLNLSEAQQLDQMVGPPAKPASK
jgi:hypothetical protein